MNAYKFTAVLLLPWLNPECWRRTEFQKRNKVNEFEIEYADGQKKIYTKCKT